MREKQKREEVKVLSSPEETRMHKRVEIFDCLMLNLQPDIPDILYNMCNPLVGLYKYFRGG